MYTCKYPHLFQPLKIGKVTFRNRIFAAPTGLFWADPAHRPLYETRAFNERKAMGGCASVCVGDVMVDGKHANHGRFEMAMDDPELYPALNRLAMDISRHGAVPTIEMFHGGAAAAVSYNDGYDIYGPQDEEVTGALGQRVTKAKGATREIMDQIIEKHVNAAQVAVRCGFGMIFLHAGHGFLLHEFLSPTLNHRTDEYGGCFENNIRFPMEVVKAVREAVGPDVPIEMRISGSEVYEGGYDISYGCKIAEAFDGIVDIIHVSCGSHEDSRVFTVTHPSMFLADACNVKYAAEIKKHVKKSYVATVGALSDPEILEEIIASGKADIVELGRGLICDPELPNKARQGRDEEILKCCRCLTCFSSLIGHGQIACALNPEIVDAHERKFERTAPKKKKVLVAGGGVGGMEAAKICAKRGHDVILCEKSDALGGIMRCEENVPFKKHIKEYLEQQAMYVNKAENIEVRLNTPVTPELAAEIEPDVIICSIGAKSAKPAIPGIEKTVDVTEVFADPAKAGKKTVILGGGLAGAELAVYLRDLGVPSTLVEMGPRPNVGDNMLHGMALGIELASPLITKLFGTKVVEVGDGTVTVEGPEGTKVLEADTVVCALGQESVTEETEALRFAAPEFFQIGSCLTPGTIYEATRLAYNIAIDIGER